MAERSPSLPLPGANAEIEQDLGFGRVLSEEHNYRLLNRDGSFNVTVEHGSPLKRLLSYHTFLNLTWPHFFAVFGTGYLLLNAVFALLYMAGGPRALSGDEHLNPFWRAFFFSVHTFATVGYGNIAPDSGYANAVVTFETLVGLMAFALTTGLIFARFSRPVADLRYSSCAIIAPYQSITAFEFRVVNGRRNQLINLEATVMLSRFEGEGPDRPRRFYQLKLERHGVALFPLNWTVVHPIDEQSPLYGWTKEMMLEAEVEIAILITAIDETFAQAVNSRASYTAREIQFGRRFVLMYALSGNRIIMDLEKLDATESAALPG
ncbi:MAG TPA: ion channel [Terriglobales bacterium]|nr:ion channel [Terriglobales bacterium]